MAAAVYIVARGGARRPAGRAQAVSSSRLRVGGEARDEVDEVEGNIEPV
jgi:hypothetical protein